MQGTFVLSTYRQKNEVEKRQVDYRRKTKLRYVALLIACLVVFGCEYCFDTPSALQSAIKENYSLNHPEKMGEAEFNLLYSLYAFPNVIIPIIGGMMIDKIGARIVLIITCSICVVGQAVYFFGGLNNAFAIMLLGRVLFGVGG